MKWLFGLIVAVAVGVLGRDLWGWLPRLSRAMIWLGTLPLPGDRRRLRREEWCAELDCAYDDRRLSGLIWALGLVPVAAWERLTISASARPDRIRSILGPPQELGALLFVLAAIFAMIVVPLGFATALVLLVLEPSRATLLTAVGLGLVQVVPVRNYLRARARSAAILEIVRRDVAAREASADYDSEYRDLLAGIQERCAKKGPLV